MHDLGYHYPNATGHNDGNDEEQPLEGTSYLLTGLFFSKEVQNPILLGNLDSLFTRGLAFRPSFKAKIIYTKLVIECGDMILMTLAYAQRTRDTAYLSKHYDILQKLTQYLINKALFPAHQMSTDDFAGPLANQTNLALKGIIGIAAMASIANLTGNAADGAKYTTIAHSYISRWQSLGVATETKATHSTLSYNQNDTYGILYNLYCDSLLSLKLVPQTIYEMQSEFYPTIDFKYGISLDSRHHYTKRDWEMWAAAISSESTKNMLIRDLAK
jgi:hypothetical protein